ncbi:MAG TPA: hypothetical protein V6D19_07390 [Stenomitos sp.]
MLKYILAITFIALVQLPSNASKAIFATVDDRGVIPVADAEVIIVPCAPINKNCQQIIDYLTATISGIRNPSPSQLENLSLDIKAKLKVLKNSSISRTNLSGISEINCETQNCLLFTKSISNNSSKIWVVLQPKDKDKEYANSSAISISGEAIPKNIQKLYDALRSISSNIKSNISYNTYSELKPSLVLAIDEATSETDIKYSSFKEKASKISKLMDITDTLWSAQIRNYRTSYGLESSTVSCQFAKQIAATWNSVLGIDELGKPTGGLLGCTFGVDLLKTRKNSPTALKIMLSRIYLEIDSLLYSIQVGTRELPEINPEFKVDESKFNTKQNFIDTSKYELNEDSKFIISPFSK